MEIEELLRRARAEGASDVHLTTERAAVFRIDGTLTDSGEVLSKGKVEELIYDMAGERQIAALRTRADIDFSYEAADGRRYRVNAYMHRGRRAAAIRIINEEIPTFTELSIPDTIRKLADEPRGLVLVTGPTGSGKSTTLAAMIDYINENKACHIITIEDPIEYIYREKRALIHQRGIGEDVKSFSRALKSAMREDPDVILVGEMRDYETISAAVTAAETGHLVLSTLHTTGAALTIDRIIDAFPPHNQQQIRTQLASVIKGVVTQTLLPKAGGKGRVAAFEIMLGTDAVLNLIRENKCHQLNSTIQTSRRQGMILMDTHMAELVRSGVVSKAAAMEKASNRNEFSAVVGQL